MAGPSLGGPARWPALVASLLVAIGLFLTQQIIRISEEEITLPLTLAHAPQTVIAGNPPEEVRFRLRGPADTLALVRELSLGAEVDARTLPVGVERRLPVQLLVPDPELADEFSWEASPSEIPVLLDRYAEREVPVSVPFSGSPAPGYEVDRFFVVPPTVRVAGPGALVESVAQLRTVPVDLTERNADFSVRLNPLLPDPRLSLPVEGFVEFRGFLREVPTAASFTAVPVRVEGSEIDVDISPPAVTIVASGLPSLLAEVTSQQIDVILRVPAQAVPNELPVELTLTPEVLLPDGLTLERVEPASLQVRVRARGVPR